MEVNQKTKPNNLVDVLGFLSTQVDEKIDLTYKKRVNEEKAIRRRIESLQSQYNILEAENKELEVIPGIPISHDVANIQKQIEHLKSELLFLENAHIYIQEKTALKTALSSVRCFIMNRKALDQIIQKLSLVKIYKSSESDGSYCVFGSHKKTIGDFENKRFQIERHNAEEKKKESDAKDESLLIRFFAIFIIAIAYFFVLRNGFVDRWLQESFDMLEYTAMFTSPFVLLGVSVCIYFVVWLKTGDRLPYQAQYNNDTLVHPLLTMFPKHIVRSQQPNGVGVWSYITITLPNPPTRIQENIRKAVKVFSQLPKGEICTIADPNAAQIEVVRTSVKSPIIKAVKADPGIVYEYGNFAVIMPDTFYHITKIEAKFLDEVIALSEKWDVRSFVAN